MQSRSKRIKLDPNLQEKIPIDPECELRGKCLHYREADKVYDVVLIQTDLQHNVNKFFLIQLLEEETKKQYNLWVRSGRVGRRGRRHLVNFNSDLEEAKDAFEQEFYDNTQNHWKSSSYFCKVPGKYDMLNIDRTPHQLKDHVGQAAQLCVSKLDSRLYSLLEMICDKTTMENATKDMKYDPKTIPFRRLTKEQTGAGCAALNILISLIKSSGDTSSQLVQASSDFYTRIPHSLDLGTSPVIRTLDMVRQKIKMLECLSEVSVAMSIMDENPIDRYYKWLDCKLKVLYSWQAAYKTIRKFLTNTRGPTHITYNMNLVRVYECEKSSDFINYGNRKLLWHGSKQMSNWNGILKKGLKVPLYRYGMFGNGIYFADISSKSANYCARSSDNCGLLALCEVSLGKVEERYYSSSTYSKPGPGFNSVKGMGLYRPRPENVELISGVKAEVGPGEFHPASLSSKQKFSLIYNEYVVYDARQVRLKYIVHVKF